MMLFLLLVVSMTVETSFTITLPGTRDLSAISSLSCPTPAIRNGAAKLKKKGTKIKYKCYRGYTRVGPPRAKCIRGSWKPRRVPTCVSTGCDIPLKIENGNIENVTHIKDFRTSVPSGSVLRYSCDPGHTMDGDPSSWCDGFLWNSSAPLCHAPYIPPATSCSFTNSNLCGWSQRNSSLNWITANSSSPTFGTGPSEPTGHYIFLESSGKQLNDSAKIFSPVYSEDLSKEGCLEIKVCMYGADIGELIIGVIPEAREEQMTGLKKLSGNYGEGWLTLRMDVLKRDTPWQVVIQGILGKSYLSDIAVAEVKLLQGVECKKRIGSDPSPISEKQLSPMSCWGRCEKNGSQVGKEQKWNEGVCDCTPPCLLGSNQCCEDFVAQCNHNKISPRMDTPSWMTWSMVSGGAVMGVIVLMALLVLATSYCKAKPPQQDYMEEDDEMKYIMGDQVSTQEVVRRLEYMEKKEEGGQEESGEWHPQGEGQQGGADWHQHAEEWQYQQGIPGANQDVQFTPDFSEFIDFTMAKPGANASSHMC